MVKDNIIEGIKYLREENIGKVQNFVPSEFLIFIPGLNEYAIKYGNYVTVLEKGDYIIKKSEDHYRVYKEQTHRYQF